MVQILMRTVGREIASMKRVEFLGGWITHEDCGYEAQFKPSIHSGFCQPLAIRPRAPPKHNQVIHSAF
jgi:hypothetical protein